MTEITLLVVVGVFTALVIGYGIGLRAVPMPSLGAARREMLAYVPKESCAITDIGSGWGDMVMDVARRRPDCRVLGIEYSPVPWAISRVRAQMARLPNLTIRRGNFLKTAFDPGDVVLCFLDPRIMADVGRMLATRMKPGGIVISRAFAIPGWQAFAEIPMQGSSDRLYIYRITGAASDAPAR
ncbi:MAG: class I SAM-dependent methyltransferase [Pseudomonadota bacterium]